LGSVVQQGGVRPPRSLLSSWCPTKRPLQNLLSSTIDLKAHFHLFMCAQPVLWLLRAANAVLPHHSFPLKTSCDCLGSNTLAAASKNKQQSLVNVFFLVQVFRSRWERRMGPMRLSHMTPTSCYCLQIIKLLIDAGANIEAMSAPHA
jgi:hypothetical protein